MDIFDVLIEVLEGFEQISAMIDITFEKLVFRNIFRFFGLWGKILLFIFYFETWRRRIIAWNNISRFIQDGIFGCNCERYLSMAPKSQCGNLRIFLPLEFYVKAILVIFKTSKPVILTILEPLN